MKTHEGGKEMAKDLMKRISKACKSISVDVGVVKEARKNHKNQLRPFHGVMALKKGKKSNITNSRVSVLFRKNTRVNIWTRPFKDKASDNLIKFAREWMKQIMDKAGAKGDYPNKNRITNLAQAVIRNPILRGDYGKGSFFKKGIKVRGIWTGQLFDSIKAKLNV